MRLRDDILDDADQNFDPIIGQMRIMEVILDIRELLQKILKQLTRNNLPFPDADD